MCSDRAAGNDADQRFTAEGRPLPAQSSLVFPTQRLFGLDFVSEATITEIANGIAAAASDRTSGFRCVVTPNVDHLVRYRRIEREAEVARDAVLVLPDGMPIVWASRLLGAPLRARLTGSDLFETLWPKLVAQSVPVAVIASSDAVADRLRAGHRATRVLVPPLFDVDDEDSVNAVLDWVDHAVDEIDARVVVVGVSMPKHHLIAHRLAARWRGRIGTPIVMLLGASADLALGLTRRAPRWMQRAGLEWLYRLALEPRRLARRYLVDDVAFLTLLGREWWTRRRHSTQTGHR